MADNTKLLEILAEFNCGKCRHLGKMYSQAYCYWNGSENGILVFPDYWHPFVCKNFEKLRDGEEFGCTRGNFLKGRKEMRNESYKKIYQ